jgi:hypothetical protein
VAVSYDELSIGVGYFGAAFCEHDWCRDEPRQAVVYFEGLGVDGHYLCLRHFNHMIAALVDEHVELAVDRGRLEP